VDPAVFEAVYRRNQETFNSRDLDTGVRRVARRVGLARRAGGEVWELAPDGRPLRVRERLDSVAPPA
jgi:hypothetical protein